MHTDYFTTESVDKDAGGVTMAIEAKRHGNFICIYLKPTFLTYCEVVYIIYLGVDQDSGIQASSYYSITQGSHFQLLVAITHFWKYAR